MHAWLAVEASDAIVTCKKTSTIEYMAAIVRVLIITLLFVACNVIFALLNPMETLGRVSLYNIVLPGRERLPYGEDSAKSYNLSTYNLPAMFASHVIARPKAADEFRVIVIGDSGTWGWLLDNPDTLAGQINAQNLTTADGKHVVAYNLGYPVMALTKDVLILEEALKYQPDLIVWPVTLESFPRAKQVFPSIVQNNAARVRSLIERYQLNLDPNDPRFVDPDFLGQDHRRAAAQSGGLAALAGAGFLVGGHADRSGDARRDQAAPIGF